LREKFKVGLENGFNSLFLAEIELKQQKASGELKIRTSVIATNMHKTEVWTPSVVSGVKSLRTVEYNHGEYKLRASVSRNEVKISLSPPHKEQRERILGLHTLPATYTQRFEVRNFTKKTFKLFIFSGILAPTLNLNCVLFEITHWNHNKLSTT
jgi:hypothetical protein